MSCPVVAGGHIVAAAIEVPHTTYSQVAERVVVRAVVLL